MCGRFTLHLSKEVIERDLNITINDYHPSYNVAPTQNILGMVGTKDGYRAGYFRWGLIPKWAKDTKIGNKMINARSETMEEKPSFRPLLARRRCVIIADSFMNGNVKTMGRLPIELWSIISVCLPSRVYGIVGSKGIKRLSPARYLLPSQMK